MKKLFLKGYLFEYDFIWIILSVCRYDPFIFNVIRPAVYGYNTSLKHIYRNINAQKINILFFTVLRKNIFDISVVYRINHFLIVRVATANRSINYSIDFTANYFWIVATHNIPSNFDFSLCSPKSGDYMKSLIKNISSGSFGSKRAPHSV